MPDSPSGILAIDIGGSHIKMTVLDTNGRLIREYQKVTTPQPATPAAVISAVKSLSNNFPGYEKISVGFPGNVKNGVVITAPNLDAASWPNTDLAKILTAELGRPAKVINDADMQGLGIAAGKGLEMVLTLGTGFGTALLKDGKLLPHFELAHHPVTKNKTYDDYVGAKALEQAGRKKWNMRMLHVLDILKTVFNYDMLYIGGGNARKLNFKPAENIKIVSNEDGIHGGAKLWEAGADGI